MKTRTLRAERKFFPSFDLKLSPKTAIKFVAEVLSIFLVASVDEFGFALALALFCGLVYARQNIIAIAPAYVLACCVFMLSWWTLLYAVVPVILLFALYAAFFKLRRNVPLWAVALCALIGMIPFAACSCAFDGAYFSVAVSVVLALVMTFCCGVAAYAVFVRGYLHKATVDELICAGLLAVVAGYALGGVNIYNFGLFYIVLGFVALFSSACFKTNFTLFICLLLGMGGALQSGNLGVLAASTAVGAAAVALSPFTKWSSALAILGTTALMWLFGAYEGAGWQTLVMTAIGVIGCLCIPKSALMRVKGLNFADNARAYTGVVNRRGREIATRLYSASDVFYDMSQTLERIANVDGIYTADRLAHEIAQNYCGKCPDKEECFSALGEDTYTVIKPMAESALDRGRVTIIDMPPFITSRCSKTHSLASVINSTADSYRRKQEINDGALIGKKMMSEQFAGIAVALDSLASKSAAQVNFAGDEVEYLKSELLKHNVVASELVVCGSGADTSAVVLVRERDASKAIISKLLSRGLKTKLEVSRIEDKGTQKLVYLDSAPVFEVAYGVAECSRDGEQVSGDSRSILCPSRSRRLFAICDGMGSGEKAAKASRDAVGMIEGFYRAGFDDNVILSLVNKLLKLSLDDCFTTLDISVIDTRSGGLDVIKLGSASSFIVRKDNVEALSCTTPPAGILDGIEPLTCRYQLFDGDMLIMMSDGVFDALESRGVIEIVDTLDTVNPQILADALLDGAKKKGAQDDCTVLVMRIFCL
ncbi:MAG: SpoIIE family protein phosphatase [Bacteroides sp.]|nr:SpoIIE family protein phosphatase [Bacillota bacterium]MCM1393602.1 SpoIIE family protein phosphatase [[Eubacterium] siraeum]MCM1455814.1 SpoIIE family protein phosphatase [Bacteroides sp.]